MGFVDGLKFIILLICVPPEFLFNKGFGFVPDILKIMCVSMLVVSLGKYLNFYERKTYMVIKWIIYIWFVLYLAYVLEYFNFSKEYTTFDCMSIGFSIGIPLCVFVVWHIGKNWLAKRIPFDIYYIAMAIYGIIGMVWFSMKPEEININLFVFYWGLLTIILTYLFSFLSKGVLSMKDAKFWHRIFNVLKIIGFVILVSIVSLLVFSLEPEETMSLEIWWFGVGGIILFAGLSIYYFQTKMKKFFILLMVGSESLLFVDIMDFLLIFITPLGVILFLFVTFFIALILYLYTQRAKAVGIALFIAILFSVAFMLLVAINDERIFENWMVGLSFALIFIILYIIPPGKLWTIIKRVHLTLIIFFLSLFLLDIYDFLMTLNTIYF